MERLLATSIGDATAIAENSVDQVEDCCSDAKDPSSESFLMVGMFVWNYDPKSKDHEENESKEVKEEIKRCLGKEWGRSKGEQRSEEHKGNGIKIGEDDEQIAHFNAPEGVSIGHISLDQQEDECDQEKNENEKLQEAEFGPQIARVY